MGTESLSRTEFDNEVRSLQRLKGQVAAALRPAVEAILKFANAYHTVHKRIGPDYDRRVALRARLGLDEYQHQRLMAIATQSKTLTQFSRALPPAVEPLYEIARLARDAAGAKRLRTAIKRHELTPTSGIREIRSIRNATQRSAKPSTVLEPELHRPPPLEFIIEADETLRWNAVEEFKAELSDLLAKYGLRFGVTGGLKNEAAVKQFIERRSAQCDPGNRAPSEPDLDTLRDEYDRLNGQYTERVQRRVEQVVRGLIDKKWKAKFGAALRSTTGRSFQNRKARWDYAAKRTGIFRDEITGGDLDPSVAWVNSARELEVIMEKPSSGSPSMLKQAVELGSDAPELAKAIIAARNSVRVPKRREQIEKLLERADAEYRYEHAAEIEADIAKQRELRKRLGGHHMPWVAPGESSGAGTSLEQQAPSREDDLPD